MEDDFYRTCRKQWNKKAKFLCTGVAPDALSGSATYVRVLDRWLMDYIKELHHEHKHEKARGKAWFTQGGVEKHNFTG